MAIRKLGVLLSRFEIHPAWARRVDGPAISDAIARMRKHLHRFEQLGIHAARVLIASSVGSQITSH
jgi:hypothetical protein